MGVVQNLDVCVGAHVLRLGYWSCGRSCGDECLLMHSLYFTSHFLACMIIYKEGEYLVVIIIAAPSAAPPTTSVA